MIPRLARVGRCVDASTPISEVSARSLVEQGVSTVVRTLAYKPGATETTDLTATELAMLIGVGLGVMLYQRVRSPGWMPGQADGYLDAVAARQEAQRIGYPESCVIWCDGEGETGTADDAGKYLHDWAHGISPFSAGLYCGFSDLLTPQQRYDLPDFHIYASDAGNRHVAVCGVSWQQGAQVVIDGITYDLGTISADLLGRLPTVCAA